MRVGPRGAPKVSVCIPAYQCQEYVGNAILSVLGQTLDDFEVVVVDDGSTDGTASVVASFDDARIVLLKNARNAGVAAARNQCVAAARGEYLAWLDADDMYRPEALERHVATLESVPSAVMVHARFDVIAADGHALPPWEYAFSEDSVERGPSAYRELLARNYICPSTVMVRRQAVLRAGGYWEALPYAEDWDLWLRLAALGDFAYSCAPLAAYRYHDGSITRRAERRAAAGVVEALVLARHFAHRRKRRRSQSAGLARFALAARCLERAGDALVRGRRGSTFTSGALAFTAAPSVWGDCRWREWALAVARGNEYLAYRRSRQVLRALAAPLRDTRYGRHLAHATRDDAEWQASQRAIASRVKDVVPASATFAVVDKWDPTLIALSGRRGYHFPDLKAVEGYPRDDDEAIDQLRRVQRKGARFLVLPHHAWWWLQHYPTFAGYLASQAARSWSFDDCHIYEFALRP